MDLRSFLERPSPGSLLRRFLFGIVLGLLTAVMASTSVGCDKNHLSGPEQPPGQTPAEICLARAIFGEQSESPYILPYRVGESYSLLQSYCGPYSHSRDNQLAYDFLLPVGAAVVAARAGIVRGVVDTWADDDMVGAHNNHLFIEHEDGTTAMYAHLVQHSAGVQVSQTVVAGQLIALSGTSGTSIPHLHFGVYRTWPNRSGDDVAVNFRNAEGALDARGGLQLGVRYLALPYSDGEPGAWE